MSKDPKVVQALFGPRVRMAPSPTGFAHIGTARTTLFNFLFAHRYGGKFILRIEDTDLERSKKKYEQDILKSLKWLGIYWDEGPDIGGPCGPYRQSERINIYKKYLKQLLKENKAYYCFCLPEELEIQKQEMLSRGVIPKYSGKCAHLNPEIIKANLKAKKPAVIRFRMPSGKIKFHDLIRGNLEFDLNLIDDIIIAKSLEEPLYNFAVVIDDYLMKITHIIRGDEHISNTPKQLMIAKALNIEPPQYAHLPMILGMDKSKLSKRHGATAIYQYKEQGYLPEALVNFIALLGWHPSGNQEIFTMEELIKQFSLERVQKAGAIFNIEKLDWLNSYYLRQYPPEKLMNLLIDYLKQEGIIEEVKNGHYRILKTGQIIDQQWLDRLLTIAITRINKFADLLILCDFLFQDDIEYPAELLIWKNASFKDVSLAIDKLLNIFLNIDKDYFRADQLQMTIFQKIDKDLTYKSDRGLLLWPLRAALTGKKVSPGPFEVAELLGKERCLKRLKKAQEILVQADKP